jgi:hypothetical protein
MKNVLVRRVTNGARLRKEHKCQLCGSPNADECEFCSTMLEPVFICEECAETHVCPGRQPPIDSKRAELGDIVRYGKRRNGFRDLVFGVSNVWMDWDTALTKITGDFGDLRVKLRKEWPSTERDLQEELDRIQMVLCELGYLKEE